MYNLFGLLTTVNHPDVMMFLVDRKWYTFIFILTYMFTTNILGLNLLLAIVYGEYCAILEDSMVSQAELRKTMMETAFNILDPDGDGNLSPNQVLEILRMAATAEHGVQGTDTGYFEFLVRCIDSKGIDQKEGEISDLDHGTISKEDLLELLVFYSAPTVVKSMNKPKARYDAEMATLKERLETTNLEEEKAYTQGLIEDMESVTVEQWCATFPTLHYWVFEFGAGRQGVIEDEEAFGYEYWPLQDDSYFCQLHTLYFLFFLVFCVFQTSKPTAQVDYKAFVFFSAVYQLVYFIIIFVARMRPWQTLHFFNPNSKETISNYSIVGLLVCLWVEFFCYCNLSSCFDESVKTSESKLLLMAAAVGKIFQVASYSVETPSVFLLFKAIMKTLPTLGPHFGLFLAIYYGFAGMGLAFFCGTITETPMEGGVGYWGQMTFFQPNLLGPGAGAYTHYPIQDPTTLQGIADVEGVWYYPPDYCQPCCQECDELTDIANGTNGNDWCRSIGDMPDVFFQSDRKTSTVNCTLTQYWTNLEGTTSDNLNFPRGTQSCIATAYSLSRPRTCIGDGSNPNKPYTPYMQGSSAATGVEWSLGSPYYFNLNYNGFAQAIANLYVVTIQNNWSVAASLAVDTKNTLAYRWYFFWFTLINAFVMINVLVGAIIDALDAVRQDSIREAEGELDPLEKLITERIETTVGPSGMFYGKTWELLDMPLHGEVRYDAQLCPALFPSDEEVMAEECTELEGHIAAQIEKNAALYEEIRELEKKVDLQAQVAKTSASAPSPPKSATAVI